MMIRLYNARILTMEKDRPIFWGEIHVKEDKILRVVRLEEKNNDHFDQEIDCKGSLLMPGFKDAHTHSPMTFLRSYADDQPLNDWLHKQVFPMEAKLDEESIYQFGRLAVLEYLTSGITGIFDMYLRPEVMADVCEDTGMRGVLVSGLNDFTSSPEQMEREFLRFRGTDHPLVTYQLGFHAEYTTSEPLLKEVAALAHQYKAPVYCHLSETEAEVRGCMERHGRTPTAYLDSLGIYDFGGGGYHCVYMTEEDLKILRDRHLYVVTNPASNCKLASGIAPIAEFARCGIPVAIGTDGPASNNCLDMFREMFLVSGLSKIREKDAASLDAGKVLEMATIGGAGAMRLPDCDVLAAGKQADLILIDLNTPNMQPIHNIAKNIVYSGSKSNVKLTMIAGVIRYRDGEFFIGDSPEVIYRECEKCLQKMKNK